MRRCCGCVMNTHFVLSEYLGEAFLGYQEAIFDRSDEINGPRSPRVSSVRASQPSVKLV
jgi:hypothetical protein